MLELQYFGIDWLATVLTFLGIWQIGKKHRIGFVIIIGGNLSWITVGIMTESLAMIVANVLFIMMNLWAIRQWSKPE